MSDLSQLSLRAPGARSPRPWVPALAALALAAPLGAQGTSASENGIATTQGMMAAGGSSVSGTDNTADASIGQPISGPVASSPNFQIQSAVAWSAASVNSDAPIVTGARPGTGESDGSELVIVLGFNFTAPGAGTPSVEFADGFGTSPAAIGNTQIAVLTPPGENQFGNPLINSKIEVTNGNGAFEAPAAFQYLPALIAANAPQLSKRFKLRLHTDPGDYYVLIFGRSISGLGVPIPPYDGAIETLTNLLVLTPALAQTPATGIGTFFIDMPSNPPLVGFPMEFQAITFDDLTLQSGAWSNLLVAPIQA